MRDRIGWGDELRDHAGSCTSGRMIQTTTGYLTPGSDFNSRSPQLSDQDHHTLEETGWMR